MAAIISADDLERFTHLEAQRQERFRSLEATWEAFKDVPDEELEREVDRAVTEARKALRATRKQEPQLEPGRRPETQTTA